MIVFGHNNFKIKTIKSSELDYSTDLRNQTFEIEVRQKYAHLFWIPFFPIGKIWGIRKENDPNLYEMPGSLKALIPEHINVKTPWYSFALIVLAGVVFLGFLGSEKLRSVKYENYHYEYLAELNMKIKYPVTGDFYSFDVHANDGSYDENTIVLKVKSYTENSIEFVSRFEKGTSSESYLNSESEIERMEEYIYNPITIPKEELYNLVIGKQRSSYNDDEVFVSGIENNCTLNEISRDEIIVN